MIPMQDKCACGTSSTGPVLNVSDLPVTDGIGDRRLVRHYCSFSYSALACLRMGMSSARLKEVYEGGSGISNVRERLRLLYGDQFEMNIRSRPGEGTEIRIDIPELAAVEASAI